MSEKQYNYAAYPSLAKRGVLITGGANGIGADLVRQFVRQGARTAFIDMDDRAGPALEKELGAETKFVRADVRDNVALEHAFAECMKHLGSLSILVNNAGNDDRHKTEDVDSLYWDERMAENLKHVFFASKLARTEMVKSGGGSIVNLGSITWRLGTGDLPVYAIAKSAIVGLTKIMAREYGVDNIRVNTVSPGWIMTDRQVNMWMSDLGEKILYERQCLKEKLMPEDISRVILWLGSDDSRLVTNQEFIIDGGWW